jgi:hypothetical protein
LCQFSFVVKKSLFLVPHPGPPQRKKREEKRKERR